jgi:hypothetical protein
MSQHLIDHVPCNKEYGYNDLFRFITDNGAVLEKDYAPYKREKGPPQAVRELRFFFNKWEERISRLILQNLTLDFLFFLGIIKVIH